MRTTRFFLLAAWLCLSLGASAQTITYFVAPPPTGNDGNDGINNPVATIARAIELASNDDIILISSGSYTQEATILVNKSLTISGLEEDVTVTSSTSPLMSITAGVVTVEGLTFLPPSEPGENSVGISITSPPGEEANITIQQNKISGFVSGIEVNQVSNLNINNNFINTNANGIVINSTVQLADIVIHENNLSGNNLSGNMERALVNNSDVLVDASLNWWNTQGSILQDVTGAITGNVEYNPWLKLSNDLDPQVEGFQGNFSSLAVFKWNESSDPLNNAFSLLSENGQISIYGSAFSYTTLNTDKVATLIGVTYNSYIPIITTLSVGLANNDDAISINNTIQANNISFTNGNIMVNSEEDGKLQLSDAAIDDLSEQTGRVDGRVSSIPKTVAANETFSALGVTIAPNDETGTDALTNLFVERITGGAGIIQNQVNGETFQSIRTYWNISVDNDNFSTRSLTLSWSTIYDNNIFPEVAIVWKNSGSEIDEDNWVQVNEESIDARVSETERSVTVGVTSFSQYTVSDINRPLPVEFTHFSASLAEPHVELNWETASEINSDFFSIERSEDGQDFQEIGTLKAAGDSDTPLQYRYIDEQAAKRFNGPLFYRLRTVDFDGSFEYSDITAVILSEDDIPMITAFARQGEQNMKLFTRAIEPGDYHIWITDLSGRKIFEENIQLAPKKSYELGIGNLPQSVYLIRCVGKQLALATKFRVEEAE